MVDLSFVSVDFGLGLSQLFFLGFDVGVVVVVPVAMGGDDLF